MRYLFITTTSLLSCYTMEDVNSSLELKPHMTFIENQEEDSLTILQNYLALKQNPYFKEAFTEHVYDIVKILNELLLDELKLSINLKIPLNKNFISKEFNDLIRKNQINKFINFLSYLQCFDIKLDEKENKKILEFLIKTDNVSWFRTFFDKIKIEKKVIKLFYNLFENNQKRIFEFLFDQVKYEIDCETLLFPAIEKDQSIFYTILQYVLSSFEGNFHKVINNILMFILEDYNPRRSENLDVLIRCMKRNHISISHDIKNMISHLDERIYHQHFALQPPMPHSASNLTTSNYLKESKNNLDQILDLNNTKYNVYEIKENILKILDSSTDEKKYILEVLKSYAEKNIADPTIGKIMSCIISLYNNSNALEKEKILKRLFSYFFENIIANITNHYDISEIKALERLFLIPDVTYFKTYNVFDGKGSCAPGKENRALALLAELKNMSDCVIKDEKLFYSSNVYNLYKDYLYRAFDPLLFLYHNDNIKTIDELEKSAIEYLDSLFPEDLKPFYSNIYHLVCDESMSKRINETLIERNT